MWRPRLIPRLSTTNLLKKMNNYIKILDEITGAHATLSSINPPEKGGLNRRKLEIEGLTIPAELAVDCNGAPLLILCVTDNVSSRKTFWESRGIRAEIFPPADATAKTKVYVETNSDYSPSLFASLAASIIGNLMTSKASSKQAVMDALDEWKSIFLSARDPLNETKLLGLIGELATLELGIRHAGPEFLDCWVGPSGERQDFRRDALAIECKANGSGTSFIQINGHDQLEAPEDGQLFLSFVQLEKAPDSTYNLPGLIERISSLGARRPLLEEKIMKAGATTNQMASSEPSYSLVGHHLFRVGEGFPKITSKELVGGNLPSGVNAIAYRIDLGVAQKHVLSPEEAISCLKLFIAR
jgi:hypothetical protein